MGGPRQRAAGPWDGLDAALAGEVLLPGTTAYETARRPAIAAFADVRPEAVVRCAEARDVAAAIAFARGTGRRLAVRGGGHCFAGTSSTDGVLIDLSALDAVTLDGDVATVGGGTRLGALYDALDAHGRTLPAGCGATVGIGGLTLGGGLGILGRAHGLTSDRLRAAEVVLADGRIVTCDAARDADLFWALRGAGGARFGVVCALVFDTVPAPAATAFELRFAPGDAIAIIGAWQAWAPDAPEAMAASLLVTAGGAPAEPPRVTVFGAMAEDEAQTTAELVRLAAAASVEPASATVRGGGFRDAKRFLAGLGGDAGEDADHASSRSEFFARSLPAATVEALVGHLLEARVAGCARELDFTPLGGAYARVAPDATAFAHRDARFLLKHGVVVEAGAAPAVRAGAEAWLGAAWKLTHPHGTGGSYVNFPEPGHDPWARAYLGANRDRLLDVKRRYDPHGVFGSRAGTDLD